MMTNSSAATIMNGLFYGTKWVALFNADPTPSGVFTNEMAGESYVRKQITFNAVSGRTSTSGSAVWWTDLPYTPIRYIAICTAESGGTMLAYGATGSDIYVGENQKFTIEAGDLAFTLGSES